MSYFAVLTQQATICCRRRDTCDDLDQIWSRANIDGLRRRKHNRPPTMNLLAVAAMAAGDAFASPRPPCSKEPSRCLVAEMAAGDAI